MEKTKNKIKNFKKKNEVITNQRNKNRKIQLHK